MDYVDVCPAAVVERIELADLGSSDAGTLMTWIASQGNFDCTVASVVGIGERLSSRSHPVVIADFCGSVASYASSFDRGQLAKIRAAYLRIPYDPTIALTYFMGLRATGIDIRDHLRLKVRIDWNFVHPRQNAPTWHYFMYLASLGEPGALEDLAAKIAATANGNDATNLLESLAELQVPGVDAILRSYANDRRRADGTEEPGLPISENVKMWLAMRGTE